MRTVILKFPDRGSLAAFLANYEVPNTKVSADRRQLTAELSQVDIDIACYAYRAYLQPLLPGNDATD